MFRGFFVAIALCFILGFVFWLCFLWYDRNKSWDDKTNEPYRTAVRIRNDVHMFLATVFSARCLLVFLTVLLPAMLLAGLASIKLPGLAAGGKDLAVLAGCLLYGAFNLALYRIWRRYCPPWRGCVALLLILANMSFFNS